MLHIVSTGLVLLRLELWLGSQWKSEKLMTSALRGLFAFLVATAEALAFCDESFRCMMGNVTWGWTIWNQSSFRVPGTLVKHLLLTVDKIRYPGCSVVDLPEWWNLTKMVEDLGVRSHTKPTEIRASFCPITSIIPFVHSSVHSTYVCSTLS